MTSPSEDYAALRDHVLAAMAEKHWDQNVLARAADLTLRTVNKVCSSQNPGHVGARSYAAIEVALVWPAGQCGRILRGEPLTNDDDVPSLELALQRLRTAKESVAAAERILRLLQQK